MWFIRCTMCSLLLHMEGHVVHKMYYVFFIVTYGRPFGSQDVLCS